MTSTGLVSTVNTTPTTTSRVQQTPNTGKLST